MEHENGVYDDLCESVRLDTNAEIVGLIVVNGAKGHGFSIQSNMKNGPLVIAKALEATAKQIRAEFAKTKGR